eukprot:353213-Chlamydomonas_euryale.AAC.2
MKNVVDCAWQPRSDSGATAVRSAAMASNPDAAQIQTRWCLARPKCAVLQEQPSARACPDGDAVPYLSSHTCPLDGVRRSRHACDAFRLGSDAPLRLRCHFHNRANNPRIDLSDASASKWRDGLLGTPRVRRRRVSRPPFRIPLVSR